MSFGRDLSFLSLLSVNTESRYSGAKTATLKTGDLGVPATPWAKIPWLAEPVIQINNKKEIIFIVADY